MTIPLGLHGPLTPYWRNWFPLSQTECCYNTYNTQARNKLHNILYSLCVCRFVAAGKLQNDARAQTLDLFQIWLHSFVITPNVYSREEIFQTAGYTAWVPYKAKVDLVLSVRYTKLTIRWPLSALSCTSSKTWFLPRDARMHSADYAVARCLSVCRSVCLSVCLSHAGIVSKRLGLYISSNFFSPSGSHTILIFPHQTVC